MFPPIPPEFTDIYGLVKFRNFKGDFPPFYVPPIITRPSGTPEARSTRQVTSDFGNDRWAPKNKKMPLVNFKDFLK